MRGQCVLGYSVSAMPLSMSGHQINKLGERLASIEPITDADRDLLAQLASDYQAVLDQVEAKLQTLGLQATTRVKTTSTLVDKLRRPPHLPLRSIHDIAGARIVIDGGRYEQDQVRDQVMAAFADSSKASVLIDRREDPRHGYRAVHVVVFEEAVPVEIQIRTKLQDSWAQISEKLGDMWGRGLRYGLGPDEPDRLVNADDPNSPTRGSLVMTIGSFADSLAGTEALEKQLAEGAAKLAGQKAAAHDLMDTLLRALIAAEGAS